MKRFALLLLTALVAMPAWADAPPGVCRLGDDPDPPKYYAIDLVPTKRVPGARMATGTAHVTFAPSPFIVALTPEGHYVYDLRLQVEKLRPAARGHYVVWASTPQLDEVQRIGVLGADGSIEGRVGWNKFLVIITLEETDDPAQTIWQGPVVLRGMSRSGLMHTMAGHGPFETEPCAVYGY